MPDSLIINESPAYPSVSTAKRRCAKARKSKPGRSCGGNAKSTETIADLAAVQSAAALRKLIWSAADDIEVGTRRASISYDLACDVMEDVTALGVDAKDRGDGRLDTLTSRLYLLLGIVGRELDDAHEKAKTIMDAARACPAQSQCLDTGENLLALRLQLKAAEDALNATDNDEPPLADAYDEANERFLEAAARTPSDILLKLERLADLGDAASDPEVSTNRIVLNLIRDLRGALGINGQSR